MDFTKPRTPRFVVEVCSFEEDFSPLCSLKIFFAPLNPTVPVPYSGIYQGSESRAQAYVPSHKVFLMMASSSNLSCRPRALRLHSTTIRTSNYSCLTRAISSSQSQSHSQYEQYEQQAAQTRRHQQPTPPPTPQVKDTFRYRLVDPRKHTVGNVRVDVLQTTDQHTNTSTSTVQPTNLPILRFTDRPKDLATHHTPTH